jgi:hypothetical protein
VDGARELGRSGLARGLMLGAPTTPAWGWGWCGERHILVAYLDCSTCACLCYRRGEGSACRVRAPEGLHAIGAGIVDRVRSAGAQHEVTVSRAPADAAPEHNVALAIEFEVAVMAIVNF